jgi:hypothetical protein
LEDKKNKTESPQTKITATKTCRNGSFMATPYKTALISTHSTPPLSKWLASLAAPEEGLFVLPTASAAAAAAAAAARPTDDGVYMESINLQQSQVVSSLR